VDNISLVSFVVGELISQVADHRAIRNEDGTYIVNVKNIRERQTFPIDEIRARLGGRTLNYVDGCEKRGSIRIAKDGAMLCRTEGSEGLLLQLMWTHRAACNALASMDFVIGKCHPGQPLKAGIQKVLVEIYTNFLANMG
jgi:hypothetical protein